jgi:hypothetical protein
MHPDYAPVARRIQSEVADNWDDTAAVACFDKRDRETWGRFLWGQTTPVGPRRIQVGEKVFTASVDVVLATGSAPVQPLILGSPRPTTGPTGRRSRLPNYQHIDRARRCCHRAGAGQACARFRPDVGRLELWRPATVTGVGVFTDFAVYQARIAADDVLGIPGPVPTTRCCPGSVGLSRGGCPRAVLKVRTNSVAILASPRSARRSRGSACLTPRWGC